MGRPRVLLGCLAVEFGKAARVVAHLCSQLLHLRLVARCALLEPQPSPPLGLELRLVYILVRQRHRGVDLIVMLLRGGVVVGE